MGLGSVLVVDKNTGNVLDTFTSPDFSDLELFDVALAPDNTFYVLGDVNSYTGVIVHMNLQGQTLGEFTMPVTDAAGYASPEGFGLDPNDGSFWVPLVNSATLTHVSSSGALLATYPRSARIPMTPRLDPTATSILARSSAASSVFSIRRLALRRNSRRPRSRSI